VRAALRVTTLALLAFSSMAPSASRPAASRPDVDPEEAVHAMLRPMAKAPEATARVWMERSDPFGGPPDVERGRLWYLPGRGLRYQSERKGGHDMVIDRERDAFLVYSPAERLVYRAPFARSPLQIRRLIADPEQILAKDLRSTPERRVIRGTTRSGYRLRPASLAPPVDLDLLRGGVGARGAPGSHALEDREAPRPHVECPQGHSGGAAQPEGAPRPGQPGGIPLTVF